MEAPTEHVTATINGTACEVEYRDSHGNVVGFWAYGAFDPSYPFQGGENDDNQEERIHEGS